MSYWACAQLETNRERLALHCLDLAGYQTYLPRIRAKRITRIRKPGLLTSPLFPGYYFVLIELQWHAARWSPGIIRLVLDGVAPARVPDRVIADLKERERNGLIELSSPSWLKPGDQVRVIRGVFAGWRCTLAAHERVAVLLQLLGRVELPKGDDRGGLNYCPRKTKHHYILHGYYTARFPKSLSA
jgi:transcriptional antiterminator RfaH